jgi:hypothetical protein
MRWNEMRIFDFLILAGIFIFGVAIGVFVF